MAGAFDGSNDRYANLTDSTDLTWNSSGWVFNAHVFSDSSITDNTFGYIYSHGTPLGGVPAFNVIRNGPAGTLRIILDNGPTVLDATTAVAMVDDVWNNIIFSYNGVNVFAHINGSTQTFSPPALGSINPTGSARIGFAVQGGSRQFAGRIAHVAKWDTTFTTTQGINRTKSFMSPGMYRANLAFHIPMFDQKVFDEQGNIATSAVSMQWGNHPPIISPRSPTSYFIPSVVDVNELFANVRYG